MAGTLMVVAVLLLALVTGAEAFCVPTFRTAGDDPAYRYAAAYIDALGYGKQAIQRGGTGVQGESDVAAFTRTLTELELGAKDFECAASLMAGQRNYATDDSSETAAQISKGAREAAELAALSYLALANNSRASAELLNRMLAGRVQMSEMPAKMARISAETSEHWRSIFYVVTIVTHVLVDPEPDSAGRMSRLRITAAQRRDLVKSIDDTFGAAARKSAAGQIPVDGAAATFRQFLTGPHTDRGAGR
jgi:hypothetical protein